VTTEEVREALREFYIGCAIVIVTAVMQANVLFNNAEWTMASFGSSFFILYTSAAVVYVLLPWIEPYIEGSATHFWRLFLLGFCFWVGMEEFLHSSHAYAAPEGLTAVAEVAVDHEKAKNIAIIVVAFAGLMLIEVLWHLHLQGATLVRKHFGTVVEHHRRRKTKRPS